MSAQRTPQELQCAHCRTRFRPSRCSSRFCSRPCFYAARRAPARQCGHCKQTLHSRHAESVFCSRRCSGLANTASRGLRKRECRYCKQPFQPRQARTVLCSLSCRFDEKRPTARRCPWCNKSFRGGARPQVFCSNACRGAASRTHGELKCRWCAAAFRPRKKGARFCSAVCGLRARTAHKLFGLPVAITALSNIAGCSQKVMSARLVSMTPAEAIGEGLGRMPKPRWKCEHCEKTFERSTNRSGVGPRFCSHKCVHEAARGRNCRRCAACRNEFVARGPREYCSRTCAQSAHWVSLFGVAIPHSELASIAGCTRTATSQRLKLLTPDEVVGVGPNRPRCLLTRGVAGKEQAE